MWVVLLRLPICRTVFKFVLTKHKTPVSTVEFSVYLTAMTLAPAVNLAVIVLHFFRVRLAGYARSNVYHVFEGL